MHRIDGDAVQGAKGDVQLPRLGAGGRAEPEAGHAIGTRQSDHQALTAIEAHHLAHPERREQPQVEGERCLDLGHLSPEMTEHDRKATRRAAATDDALDLTYGISTAFPFSRPASPSS